MATMQIVRIGSGSTQQHCAEMIGAKAANLERIAAADLPVPPAFVLPVELCAAISKHDSGALHDLAHGLKEGMEFLEAATGKVFGDGRRPLLVSVRSGAARSMPGMLDTVLNVGCTPAAVRGLVRLTGDPRFASDCRRRFLESYGEVVLGIEPAHFVQRLEALIAAEGAGSEQGLDCEALDRLIVSYEQGMEDENDVFADEPLDQLKAAAEAVYRSWTSERACTYRRLQHLEDLQGTAVTVQAMVFGNVGSLSGAGVAFSRDPSTGVPNPVIDILFGSQGEDVVSGRRTPQTEESLARSLPGVAAQLRGALTRLEREFADVQDVEFTIENGKLWLLQTRAAKRTPQAAVRFAIDFVKEGQITTKQALDRLDGVDFSALANKRLIDVGVPVARGTGASTGVAVGQAAFDTESAKRLSGRCDPVILLRPDTTTADIAGFAVAAGIVTAVGGRTAHAALVARQMGKPCIVGCTTLEVDAEHHCGKLSETAIREGDWVSIDAEAGTIHLGQARLAIERPELELAEIERWRAGA
jgi:pyruvate, orthophosphate dikinase